MVKLFTDACHSEWSDMWLFMYRAKTVSYAADASWQHLSSICALIWLDRLQTHDPIADRMPQRLRHRRSNPCRLRASHKLQAQKCTSLLEPQQRADGAYQGPLPTAGDARLCSGAACHALARRTHQASGCPPFSVFAVLSRNGAAFQQHSSHAAGPAVRASTLGSLSDGLPVWRNTQQDREVECCPWRPDKALAPRPNSGSPWEDSGGALSSKVPGVPYMKYRTGLRCGTRQTCCSLLAVIPPAVRPVALGGPGDPSGGRSQGTPQAVARQSEPTERVKPP